jgi:hypothetical protein
MRFDATLGFPGEGPAPPFSRQWHYKSLFFPAPALQSPCKSWVQWARATMVGTLPIHSSNPIVASSSDHHVHLCLLALAERGNQDTPIAARLQSRPARIGALLGAGDPTTLAAAGGSAYNFQTRPFQYSRPKPLKLHRFQTQAVADELSRLRHVCHAVEPAPPHDSDKAILQFAPSWEKTPLRLGPWPRERRVPVFATQARVLLYN